MKLLGLTAGSVTPLGVLNDEERKVTVFLDRDFFEESGLIGVHPNDNTATVWLKAEDLVRLIGGTWKQDTRCSDLNLCYCFCRSVTSNRKGFRFMNS